MASVSTCPLGGLVLVAMRTEMPRSPGIDSAYARMLLSVSVSVSFDLHVHVVALEG